MKKVWGLVIAAVVLLAATGLGQSASMADGGGGEDLREPYYATATHYDPSGNGDFITLTIERRGQIDCDDVYWIQMSGVGTPTSGGLTPQWRVPHVVTDVWEGLQTGASTRCNQATFAAGADVVGMFIGLGSPFGPPVALTGWVLGGLGFTGGLFFRDYGNMIHACLGRELPPWWPKEY